MIGSVEVLGYMDTALRLTSPKNPLLKEVRKAVARGTLTDDGYCVAEGLHLLEEAVRSRCEIQVVIAAASSVSKLASYDSLPLVVVEDVAFAQVAATETTQGIITLVKPREWHADAVFTPPALVAVLDGIQDPGNAGAIVRVAEAFGATGSVFLKGSVNPFNPKALRASAGSLFRLPLVWGWDEERLYKELRTRGVGLYAMAPGASATLHQIDCRSASAFIIGSEGAGVRASLMLSATTLRIGTVGVESLNAAVAAGVVFYECSRQRGAVS